MFVAPYVLALDMEGKHGLFQVSFFPFSEMQKALFLFVLHLGSPSSLIHKFVNYLLTICYIYDVLLCAACENVSF